MESDSVAMIVVSVTDALTQPGVSAAGPTFTHELVHFLLSKDHEDITPN